MKVGFIGMGHMAKALLRGMLRGGELSSREVCAYAPTREKLQRESAEIGFHACQSASEVVQKSEVIVIACKPYQIESVLDEIKDKLEGKNLLSVAAGWNFEKYHAILGDKVGIQCMMPNLPVDMKAGVVLMEDVNNMAPDVREEIVDILSTCALVEDINAQLMGAAIGITGAGPAYIALFIEAMGEAGVKNGLSHTESYRLACQTMIGTARQILESGDHPAKIRDKVCSPGGISIKGIAVLERAGVRGAIMDAIDQVSETADRGQYDKNR